MRQPPKCGPVFTSEYPYATGSSAARILSVAQSPDIDGERLKHFQDNPLIVSTFYRNYLKWYIQKYDEIRDYLKEWLDVYRGVRLGVHDRLQESHFYFNTAYSLMLQYCYERGFVSEQDVERLHRSFLRLLTGLVQAQDELAKPSKTGGPDSIDYLAHIRLLFREGNLLVADSPEVFSDHVHDGVLHNGCLCLRGKRLSKHFPTANLADVIDSLAAQGALRSGKHGRTNQIYALEGKRFYAIPLEKL